MKRSVIYIVVGMAIMIFWLAFVFVPITNERSNIQRKSQEARAKIADFQATIQRLPSYLESQKRIERLKEALNSRLYSKEELLDLFERLHSRAGSHNLRVVEISPPVEELLKLNRMTPREGQPQFLNLTLTIQGNYIDFGRFATELEESPFFRGVNGCHLSSVEDQQGILATLEFKALLGKTEDQA